VWLRVRSRRALDLELWDVAREAGLFRSVFGRTLSVSANNAKEPRARPSRNTP
jgi:hypothetical protein